MLSRHELKALLDKLEWLDAADGGEPPGQAGRKPRRAPGPPGADPARRPPVFKRPLSRTAVVHAPEYRLPARH